MKGVGKNLYLKTELQAPEVMWAVTSPASAHACREGAHHPTGARRSAWVA